MLPFRKHGVWLRHAVVRMDFSQADHVPVEMEKNYPGINVLHGTLIHKPICRAVGRFPSMKLKPLARTLLLSLQDQRLLVGAVPCITFPLIIR